MARVDIDAPVPDLPTNGAANALVVVSVRGQPVGKFELDVPLDPYPGDLLAAAIRARLGPPVAHERLRQRTSPPRAALPEVRVGLMVCTRDRPDELARCLDAIAKLSPAPAELIVIDNASRDDRTREVVARHAPNARYVYEPYPGLDRARNRGIAEATCDVLLCTDDDVEVEPTWAARLLSCFDDPLVVAATGLVLPKTLEGESYRLFERSVGFGRGFRRKVLDGTRVSPYAAGSMGAGASMAFRTDFLRSIGGFPEELDAGMPTASGGDTYALAEALRNGYRLVYEPAAVAWHTHRGSEEDLRKALRGYGLGSVSYLMTAGLRHRDPGALIRGGRYWAGYIAGKAVRARSRGVPLALTATETLGGVAAAKALRKARREVKTRPRIIASTSRSTNIAAATPSNGSTTLVHHELPPMSVVIPSRGRRDQVVRLVRALDRQHYPAGRVEIVVALDGDLDESAIALKALDTECPVSVVALDAPSGDRHHGNGAAFARNVGASRARHPVLVFLDDDVVPEGLDLLVAHGELHALDLTDGGSAGVGPCKPSLPAGETSLFALTIRNWLTDHVRLLERDASLSFADFGSGNISLTRDRFAELGGFARLHRREDWELGYRLERHGVKLVGVPEGAVAHDIDVDVANAFEDRYREGRGDAAIVRAHPELMWWLPLALWDRMSPLQLRLARAVMADERRRRVTSSLALRTLPELERLGLRDRYERVVSTTSFSCYWAGVGAECGGETGWFDLRRASRRAVEPDAAIPIDLARVHEWIAPVAGHAREVQVQWNGRLVGVAPVIWGGVPFVRQRFIDAVVSHFASVVLGETDEIYRSVRVESPVEVAP